jgi:hypothetical protein
MRLKPIKIVKVPGGYHVFVNDVPLVKGEGKGCTLDRVKAGLSTSGFKEGYKPPTETEPFLIKKASDAVGISHQVGHYMLNLGDFVYTYVELVNIPGDPDAWFNRVR